VRQNLNPVDTYTPNPESRNITARNYTW